MSLPAGVVVVGWWLVWLVNITRCCKYSQVLLMMDKNITRNT
jgi:hypothetical protein